MDPESEKMFQSLHCYHCSTDFQNLDEFNTHQCPEVPGSGQILTDYLDVQIKVEADELENGNDVKPSLEMEQDSPSTNTSDYSDFNPVNQQQQSNICLIGEDNIQVHCKKCSTDFCSLKLFLQHLHRKSHQQHVVTNITKENQRPSNNNNIVRVVNSTSLSSKKFIVVPVSNKTTSQNSVQQPARAYTAARNKPNPINSNKKSSSGFNPESESDLDADPKSDPLQITPFDRKYAHPYKCTFCGAHFFSLISLKAHQNQIIPKTACEKWGCPFTFTLNCALLKHKEFHKKDVNIKANTMKSSPKTYSRAHRPYSDKKSIITNTAAPANITCYPDIKPIITTTTAPDSITNSCDIKPDITTTTPPDIKPIITSTTTSAQL